jgi:hypothetical protein
MTAEYYSGLMSDHLGRSIVTPGQHRTTMLRVDHRRDGTMPNPSTRRCHGDDSDDTRSRIPAVTQDRRIAMLEREVTELREANEILRNVASYFALGGSAAGVRATDG